MIKKFETFITPFQSPRMVHMYLPDDYSTSGKRYPVLYMFDGHNLFSDTDATYGKSWGFQEFLEKTKLELMIVGIECSHEGNRRLSEYCPYDVPENWWGGFEGKGKDTMDWMAYELKPYIDSQYPTLPDRSHTFIGGSSMGGLMSLYAVGCYNHVYSRAACVSPSVGLCFNEVWKDLTQCGIDPDTRIFMSWGSEEARDKGRLSKITADNLAISHLLNEKGASTYPYLQVKGGHNEASWEKQVPIFMEYLYKW